MQANFWNGTLGRSVHRLTRLCLGHPKAAVAVLALATAGLAAGLPAVHPAFGYRVLVGDDHPAVRALDGFIERFGGGLPIQIAWECEVGLPCQSVFDEASMRLSHEIAIALQATSGVGRVTAPSNAPLLVPTSDGFAVRRFFENDAFVTDAVELAKRARNDPLWTGVVASRDGRAAVITVQPTNSSDETSTSVSLAVEEVLRPHEAAGVNFHLVGDPIQNLIVGRDLAESSANLVPLTAVVIALVLFGFCRSLGSVVCALATLGVALVWTFGLLGWLGWPQDGILEALAPLILVVGVCDSVHLLSRVAMAPAQASGRSDSQSIRLIDAAREVAAPAAITTITTAAAFLSFTTSDLATFVRFGSIASFGVIACLLLTFTLLPLLIRVVPERAERDRRVSDSWSALLTTILATSRRRARVLLLASAAALIVCGIGWLSHLRVDHDWTESLGEQSRVVRSQRFMEEHMGQSSTLEIEVRLPPGSSIEDPSHLRRIEQLSRRLEAIDGLDQARSIVDVIARVGELLDDDRSPGATAGRRANAEILEIVGFDDPGLLDAWLSFDRRAIRISVGAPEQASSTRARILTEARARIADTLPSDWEVLLTGRVAMQLAWIEEVQATQVRSFPTALALVFAMVAVFLRSLRLALAAMVPTVLPIVITLGAMGWAGLTLDVSRAMVAAVLLGVAVDDAIHILDHYRTRRKRGDSPANAIHAAILHTGRAVVTTSFALALGFLTLLASAWQSIASFGFFVAIAILGALLASLFVLPALIFALSNDDASSYSSDIVPHGRSRKKKLAVVALTLPLAVAVAMALAMAISTASSSAHTGPGLGEKRGGRAMGQPRVWESPCWILPTGHVLTVPGAGECPLQLLDRIRSVGSSASHPSSPALSGSEIRAAIAQSGPVASLEVLRRGKPHAVDLKLRESTFLRRAGRIATAAVLAAGLLFLPLVLLHHARSRAAIPLGVFYSAIGVILVAGLGGEQSLPINLCAILALATAPAALAQLTLVFPTESKLLRHTPRLYAAPYVATLLLATIAAVALFRAPLLWPSFVYLVLGLCGAAWLVLILACAFAVRESSSASARGEAGFVCVAGLMLPALLVAPLTWGSELAQIGAAYLWTSALVLPLPVGFAISRYNLFDVGWHARHEAARCVYLISGSLSVAAIIYFGASFLDLRPVSFGLTLTISLGCLVLAEALRRPLLGFLDAALSPHSEDLRSLRERCSRELSRLSGEHEIGQLLLQALRDGVGCDSGWVLLRHGGEWESAESLGAMPPPAPAIADAAATRLHSQAVAALLDTDPLVESGIHVIAAITHGDDPLGLVLLGRHPLPLSGFGLDFIASVTSYAAIAIHNSRLADERAAIERQATSSRVAIDLMHEIGKDLGWMRALASRLAGRARGDARTHRAAAQIGELADALIHKMRDFVADATSQRKDPPAITRLDELLDRSLRSLRERFGSERIQWTHDSTIRGVRCHENVGRIVQNLVNDAIRASSLLEPVRVSATFSPEGRMLITIIDDRGAPREAGPGIGLAISRDMTEALGGDLELSRTSAGGGRADVRIPIPERWRPS